MILLFMRQLRLLQQPSELPLLSFLYSQQTMAALFHCRPSYCSLTLGPLPWLQPLTRSHKHTALTRRIDFRLEFGPCDSSCVHRVDARQETFRDVKYMCIWLCSMSVTFPFVSCRLCVKASGFHDEKVFCISVCYCLHRSIWNADIPKSHHIYGIKLQGLHKTGLTLQLILRWHFVLILLQLIKWRHSS